MPSNAPALHPDERTQAGGQRAERLLAQRGLFSGPTELVSADLYAEIVRGVAYRERNKLVVKPDAEVNTNTYFGRFPATYWQRWTSATEVTASVRCVGSGQVRLVAS